MVLYSNHTFVANPFVFPDPFTIALVSKMEVADCVVTDGDVPAVNPAIFPLVVPLLFLAANRKAYVCPVASPIKLSFTATETSPSPTFCSAVGV